MVKYLPLVSIVVPAYNAAATIERLIVSLLRQTEPRLEVIVVDDRSSDGTAERVASIADERVRLVRMVENRGACAARNRGMEEARGAWIGFVDADDWCGPRRFERLLTAGDEAGVEMVADNLYWTSSSVPYPADGGMYRDEDGIERKLVPLFSSEMQRTMPRLLGGAEFILGNRPGAHNLNLGLIKPMFRRAFLLQSGVRWDEQVKCGQDTVFYTESFAAGGRLLVLPEAGYYYVRNESGISKSTDPLFAIRHRLETNERLAARYETSHPDLAAALHERSRALRRSLGKEQVVVARREGLRALTRLLVQRPLDVMSYTSGQLIARARGVLKRIWARGHKLIAVE